MARSIRLLVALVVLVILSAATVSSTAAIARRTFSSTMTGLPAPGMVVDGIAGAGKAWTIGAGSATLTADGRLHVEVQGLVLTSTGTNPVPVGKAVVTCGDAFAAATGTVPFSTVGNATVNAVVSLPSPCLGPAVFFTNAAGAWFAVTGF